MKKFIAKLSLIILTSTASIALVYLILLCLSSNVTGLAGEVFYVIEKAEHNSGRPFVILGDSVCNQVWPQNKDSENFSHLGCNQAITPCGTYLLLKKYLENNPQTKNAYYIIIPGSLGNDLYMNYTYQYFLIPFLNDENMNLIEAETREMLYHKFGKFFVHNGYIKDSLLNNNFFMRQYLACIQKKPEKKYVKRLSPTAIIYLNKMRDLCREHNVNFYVCPLPVKDIPENHDWENFNQDVKDFDFEDLLGDFTEKITYYPEDWFSDHVHFKHDILEQHRDEIIASVLKSPAN
ncbi:MAG: hypothetical protein IJU48_09895 [Synergistaceae bacterium]|nr:hypothetical protein [Synergistaceae bacterium]